MSWISSLLSSLGGAASTAIDEASLIANGFMDETLNANKRDAYYRSPQMTPFLVGSDPDADAMSSAKEGVQRMSSLIDSPLRAIDRAMKTYTGDELFADRPYLNSPFGDNRSMEGVAERPSDDGGSIEELVNLKSGMPGDEQGLAERMHILNMAAHQDRQQARSQQSENEIMNRLAMLQGASSQGTQSFAAKGDRVRSGSLPQPQSQENEMFNPDTNESVKYKPTSQGSFSVTQRPVVEQTQIRRLGALGVPTQAAEAIVDNSSSEGARRAIMELTSKQLTSKQDMVSQAIQSYQTNVAKADNKEAVQAALVMQLRNIGLTDPAIKMMLMSLM